MKALTCHDKLSLYVQKVTHRIQDTAFRIIPWSLAFDVVYKLQTNQADS